MEQRTKEQIMNYAEKAKDFIDEIVNDTLNVYPSGSMFETNKT